jgi:hypothetical protein
MAWRFVQQQRNGAAWIRLAYKTEESLEMRLLQVGATHQEPMPGAEVDRPKQDAFRVTPGNGDMRLFASERPRPTQDGKEAQDRLVLTEQYGVRGQVAEPAHYRPFFCARWGLSPRKNSGAAYSVTPWLACAAAGYGA